MKTKKYITYFAIAFSLVGSAMVSCSDDDKEDKEETPEERSLTDEASSQQEAVLSVIKHFSGQQLPDTLNSEIISATYEPQYGLTLDESDANTRSVVVVDAADAERNFTTLVPYNSGLLKETMDGYFIDLNKLKCMSDGSEVNFGTLTFHKNGDGSCVSYADVNIPAMPHLQRINYITKKSLNENAGFESPCVSGSVWLYDGHYYLCVRESLGPWNQAGIRGWLINIQPGTGDMYSWLESNEGRAGAWKPSHHVEGDGITSFIAWLANEDNYDIKQDIIAKYPGKVIPYEPVEHTSKNTDCEWGNWGNSANGFGTKRQGWIHWVGGDEDRGSSFFSPGSGPEVLIIRDAWEGSYHAGKCRWWRNAEAYCLAPRCKADNGSMYFWTWSYVYSRFEYCDFADWFVEKFPYTANGFSFTSSVPSGFSLVYDPYL